MLGGPLAAISPANTPHGYNLTFAFPMLLFIVIAGALYLRFRSPHKVPGHMSMAIGQVAGGSAAGQAPPASATPADAGVSEAATTDADGPDGAAVDGTEADA